MKQKSTDPKMTYSMICKVTGVDTPTNPKQYQDLMIRYDMSAVDMKNNYVSRAGRKVLTEEKLTAAEVNAKYGIHMNVATRLKSTVKAPIVVPTKPVIVVDPADVTATVNAPVVETPVDSTEEVFYDASKEDEEVAATVVA